MIRSVEITNHAGESILLELGFPEKSGFLIQDIDGLSPAKAIINTSDMVSNDGSIFNSARLTSRNILFSLAFMDIPSIEENRLKSYKYFAVKKPVKLKFETDGRICEAFGYTESNDIDIFSRSEKAIISVLCPDPYFYSVEKAITVFSTDEPLFEFPFSNESLTEKEIIFSNLKTDTAKNIIYEGDASIGFIMYIHSVGPVNGLKIIDVSTRELFDISSDKLIAITGADISEGDDIIINTIKGKKSIYLLRNGITTNILNAVDKDSTWFELHNGDNVISYTATSGEQNLQFRIENQIVFEGV